MTEIVDGLAKEGAAVCLARGNLRHHKIGLAQHNTLRVDSDKYLRDGIDLKVGRKLDETDLLLDDLFQVLKRIFNGFLRYLWVESAVLANDGANALLAANNV